MRKFDYKKLQNYKIDQETLTIIKDIYVLHSKQSLFLKQKPKVLEKLTQVAFIQSTESSNRIEGIRSTKTRIKQIVLNKIQPKTRDEKEISGYRNVLKLIEESYDVINISKNHILQLHKELFQPTLKHYGGKFKSTQNYIVSTLPDGSSQILFTPPSPFETPMLVENLTESFNLAVKADIEPLILISHFIVDFLCIHPFDDGNGRMSRLLTTLLLLKFDFKVAKYISVEIIVEEAKQYYYESLDLANKRWDKQENDYSPFVKYLLHVILLAYRELASKLTFDSDSKTIYDQVKSIINDILGKFTKQMIMEKCPIASQSRIEQVLKQLQDENFIIKKGEGKASYYIKK